MRMITAVGVAGLALGGVFTPVAASADPPPWAHGHHQPGSDDGGHLRPGWGDHDDGRYEHILPDLI